MKNYKEIAPVKANMKDMWSSFDLHMDENCDCGKTTRWGGYPLPQLPCVEQFEDGTCVLFCTKDQETEIIRRGITDFDPFTIEDLDYVFAVDPECGDILDVVDDEFIVYVRLNAMKAEALPGECLVEVEDIYSEGSRKWFLRAYLSSTEEGISGIFDNPEDAKEWIASVAPLYGRYKMPEL